MPWLCSHFVPGLIMNGPLPIGASLNVVLFAAPATDGTGLATGWTSCLSNSQSGSSSFATSV